MQNMNRNAKHEKPLPNARQIRRSCAKELYRTIKRLKTYIAPELVQQAETLYYNKVITNLLWIVENGSNRRKLSDWWEEEVCPSIAELWNVSQEELALAFRDSFGG
ncbi:MAG: hypothetical protein K0R57_3783 [Paenibacillaceae bacterium]|jgi:toxin CptA|nr:hypothetical protein [Paenibacillaceae bacterium]